MTEAEPRRTRKRRQAWRTIELAMVVLGVGLNVVGLAIGLERAGALRIHLIEQAKPQARQVADNAGSLFDEQVKTALRSVVEAHRLSKSLPDWMSGEALWASDVPSWIGALYVWEGQELTEYRPAADQPENLTETLASGLRRMRLTPNQVELIYQEVGGERWALALLRPPGAADMIVVGQVLPGRVKSILVEPLLALTKGLELVPVGESDQPWSQAMSGVMREWKIKPTAEFLSDQTHSAVWQFVSYFGLMLLSLITLLAAMWYLMRVTHREITLAEMKSSFVANVSHELKTPLSLIRLFGETLQSGRVRDEAKRQEYYSVITRESTRLTNLINNILDFARIEAGKKEYAMEPIDVGEVVRETYEAYRLELDHNGFTHYLTIEPKLPEVNADRDAIARAVLNLISNAIKYSGEECYLDIELRKDTRRGRHGVLISVEDHGIGIRPEDRAQLFDGFFRSTDKRVRTKRGSGLGLVLVKHVIDAHGGHLDVESRLVKGTTFRIFLPEAQARQAARETISSPVEKTET
ncbi:MAG: hypothetical protein JSV78_08430 [Phycisphaerales bacterium]|nr:MAG: hypothetical protein JSV78_08430 [Phycisphaerales bacterium]